MTLRDSEAKVAIENKITEKFIVNIATRKCDTLSVILFRIVLNYSIKIHLSGKIYEIKWYSSKNM